MLTFTDKHMHKVTVYFLAKKSDAFEAYKMFEAWVSIHRNAKIKDLVYQSWWRVHVKGLRKASRNEWYRS